MLILQQIVKYSLSTLNTSIKNSIKPVLWRGLNCKKFAYQIVKHNNFVKILQTSSFHTSLPQNEVKGLSEFFDEKDNWGVDEVRVGRSWRKEELRIKSNEDLHKLWYVLLKEKNMLLTMEEESKQEFKLFPNPERIDKVEESMLNLEEVVRERNRAYMLLETGESGERPADHIVDTFGRKVYRRFAEYPIPAHMNPRFMHRPTILHPVRTRFSRLLREKENVRERAMRHKKTLYIAKLFSLYPDIDIEALKHKFPEMDVDKIRKLKISRGNHDNNQG